MKNRDNLYLVTRYNRFTKILVICEAYKTMDAAQDAVDAYNQRWEDIGADEAEFFSVGVTTYYDE